MKLIVMSMITLATVITACHSKAEQAGQTEVTPKNIEVTDNKIVSTFVALPDSSIDVDRLKAHMEAYPERWQTAFRYLSQLNAETVDLGRVDLSDEVYAAVSEYTTKNDADALYESHKTYIDIQYVLSGAEYIGLTKDTTLTAIDPYSEKDDIAFYPNQGGDLHKATPRNFFIFFPDELHRPCINDGTNQRVKKVVVKLQSN